MSAIPTGETPGPPPADRSPMLSFRSPAAGLFGKGGMLLDASGGAASRRRTAARDLRDGAAQWRLAISLGWLDIRLRYRGSALGPFWLTLSSAVMVGSMGLIYGTLFGAVLSDYLPFLALSIILWQSAIGGLAGEACTVFLDAEQTIRSMRMPFTVQVLRCLVRNAIVLAHNLIVPIGVFAIYDAWPGFEALLALPGAALWVADGIAACFLLGSICARFRDVPPIVGSIMQIAFYITPIVWKPAQLGAHGWWLPLNPFYTLLEVVRAPLLGSFPGVTVWGAALGYSILFWLAAWVLFTRARPRLAFWV
jgi:lipopolysaccharide transport system permease protein